MGKEEVIEEYTNIYRPCEGLDIFHVTPKERTGAMGVK